MTNIVTFTALLLIIALFLSIIILAKVANRAVKEKDAWIAGFTHLHEQPNDLQGAFKIIASHSEEAKLSLTAASIFKEFKRHG